MSDGLAHIPLASVDGLKDAHEDTLFALINEAQDIVKDPAWTDVKARRSFNRAIGVIIARLAARNVYLPSLAAEADVEAAMGSFAVALPADFHGNLHGAWDVISDRQVPVMPWSAMQRMRGPEPLARGELVGVAIYAKQLRYFKVPSALRRIRIAYHRLPQPLTATADKPFCLPVEVSSRLLVNFAVADAFSAIEQDQGDPKSTTQDHRVQFEGDLDILAREIGPWPRAAASITDEMGW